MNLESGAIELALVSHTNAGKTTLARTLLGRDIGEVRDAPHVTEIAEAHVLIETEAGDVLRLWDTPGFGDSARLVKRLAMADNPIGWLLREVWDRYRDRPFWSNQQAVRAVRDSADVVLYLASAAEDPRDAGYVRPEMQVLSWVGKPVVVLLNQVGPPRPLEEERAEGDRWRATLEPFGVVKGVLALDAFARCWVQERVLLDLVRDIVPETKRSAYVRLLAEWERRAIERFRQAMRVLAEQLAEAARDTEPVQLDAANQLQKVLRSIGVGRDRLEAAQAQAMATLAQRLDERIRFATDRLIALHGLDGSATKKVLERLRENFATKAPVDEARGALWGSVITGALAGLQADLAAGGLSFGAGLLAGGLIGGLTGAGVVRGINKLSGADRPDVHWSADFLDGLVHSSVLRYLAVAHFGRGRGRYVEGEAPKFWQREVEQALHSRKLRLRALLSSARTKAGSAEVVHDVERALCEATAAVLDRLYPGHVPRQLLSAP